MSTSTSELVGNRNNNKDGPSSSARNAGLDNSESQGRNPINLENGTTVENRIIGNETDESLPLRQRRVTFADSTNGSVDGSGSRQQDGTTLQSPPVENPQPRPQPIPTIPARRPRPIIDDNTLITRNQLAFFLTVAFGVILAFGLAHVYKQVQTAYIVSSLLHNVPVSKTPYRKPSQPHHPSQTSKPSASIDESSNPNPASTTILKPQLSPEVEVYAQQLQRVLGSLKRALRNVDKSDNSSSQLGGIIEMKPHSEVLDEKEDNESSFPGEKSKAPNTEGENGRETRTESGQGQSDPAKNDLKGQSELRESQILRKKQEMLTNAYKLAADYVSNLHTIVDEEIRRTDGKENPDSDDAQKGFDLDKKKEDNLEVFRKFVEMVAEAQGLEDNDATTDGFGEDSEHWADKSKSKGPDHGEEETNDLYNLISEALSVSEQEDLEDWDEEVSVNELDDRMDQARKILADIHKEYDAAIESQKLSDSGFKSPEPETVSGSTEIPEKEDDERNSKENSSPLFS